MKKPPGAPQYTFLSFRDLQIAEFKRLLADKSFFEDFERTHFKPLCDRAGTLYSAMVKLMILQCLTLMALLALRFQSDIEVQIVGFVFKGVEKISDVILLIYSSTILLISLLSHAHKHLKVHILAYIELKYTKSQAIAIRSIYLEDSWDFNGGESDDRLLSKVGFYYGITLFPVLLFTLAACLVFLVVSVHVQFSTILDLAANDSKPRFTVYALAVFCFGANVSQFLVAISERRIPINTLAHLEFFKDLKEKNKDEYDRQMKLASRYNAKVRQRTRAIISATVFFTLFLTGILLFYGTEVATSLTALAFLIVGSLASALIYSVLTQPIERLLLQLYFHRYGDTDKGFAIFARFQRLSVTIHFLVVLIFLIGTFQFFENSYSSFR